MTLYGRPSSTAAACRSCKIFTQVYMCVCLCICEYAAQYFLIRFSLSSCHYFLLSVILAAWRLNLHLVADNAVGVVAATGTGILFWLQLNYHFDCNNFFRYNFWVAECRNLYLGLIFGRIVVLVLLNMNNYLLANCFEVFKIVLVTRNLMKSIPFYWSWSLKIYFSKFVNGFGFTHYDV